MTDFERDVLAFILRALLAANGAVKDSTLRQWIKNGFSHIDFTAGDLGTHIATAENAKLIAGTNDTVFGLMWDLTPTGKIKAQLLK
jgi:hypothetical protein